MLYDFNGSITAIVGPMCGGKTTRLITELRKNRIVGRRVILIRHPLDNRYDVRNKVVTHDGASESGFVSLSPDSLFSCGVSLEDLQTSYDVVCIDEGQFYSDVDIFCEALANIGLKVYVSALLGDFRREPFYNISRLIVLAEKIVHVKAIDRHTGEDASFTMKRHSVTSAVIEVGGLDLYDAVGRRSYFSL